MVQLKRFHLYYGGATAPVNITPVSTFAGTQGSYGHIDATGLSAKFQGPRRLAYKNGILYATDPTSIRMVTVPGAVVTTLAGQFGSGASGFQDGPGVSAKFDFMQGIAVDDAGIVYVADQLNQRIRKIMPDGTTSTLAGNGIDNFADGPAASAMFSMPGGVAVTPNGSIVYVADSGTNRIRKITGGQVTTLAGSGSFGHQDGTGGGAIFYNPSGICLDAAGDLYVADGNSCMIRKVTSSGVVTTIAGTYQVAGHTNGTGVGNTSFAFSDADIIPDNLGSLYLADYNNMMLRKITYGGTVTTITGISSPLGGYLDGELNVALFHDPSGIAMSSAGDLYVADSLNAVIRKVIF